VIEGRVLVGGHAEAAALVLDEPLSLWGGLDPTTGRIVEVRHPQHGEVVTGRILVMPSGRGSSSSATILAEAMRLGTAPAGIVLGEPDEILAIGALVAAELYGIELPVVAAAPAAYAAVETGDPLVIASSDPDRRTARSENSGGR
jgi:predicted aconitase with swiveling domain